MRKPIFVDGELLAVGIAVAHWTEIGGSVPGSLSPKATAHEPAPGLRNYREGERQDDLFDDRGDVRGVGLVYGRAIRKSIEVRDFAVADGRKRGVTIGHPRGGFCHAGRAERGKVGIAPYLRDGTDAVWRSPTQQRSPSVSRSPAPSSIDLSGVPARVAEAVAQVVAAVIEQFRSDPCIEAFLRRRSCGS